MRSLVITFILTAAHTIACDLPQYPHDLDSLSSADLVETGHILRAKALLAPVAQAEPANAVASWLLSKSLLGLGDLEGALRYAERSVALEPNNPDYHAQLGSVLGRTAEKASMFKQLGLARRTRKELEATVALDPKNVDGLFALMLYDFSAPSFLGGDKAKAETLAARIAEVDPTRGWMARAALARERKDTAAELDASLRAVAANSQNYDALSDLAQYYLDHPPLNLAALESSACQLLELDSGRADGWRALIEVLAASRCWTQLDEALQLAAEFNPDDLSPYYTAAAALIREGERLSAAQTYLEKYLSAPPDGSEPSHAMAHVQLATLLEKEQHPEAAIEQLNRALEEEPGLEAAKKDLKRLKDK
ncbi:MAG TPA: tetratricopeptide repeat protein [Bryobacteraceae bacterium]